MDTRWLQDFLTVAETQNFTRAATIRNASQAAFSRRIKSLEGWLGVSLIDRSVFPTRLTPEGEIFRSHAAEIVEQLSEARVDVSGQAQPRPNQVRIALPHALATNKLPQWIAAWPQPAVTRYAITAGNVHDTVTALVSGDVDLLICFHNPQQPIQLAPEQYERTIIGSATLRPYASPRLLDRLAAPWPGTSRHPAPLLMYSPGAYLARMVEMVVGNAPTPLNGVSILENDMADVLQEAAAAGHGIAWLPCCCSRVVAGELTPVGGEDWALPLSIIAYRDRSKKRASAHRLWSFLAGQGQPPSLPELHHRVAQ